MECTKCQSQDGEYKSGVSKKNGKPWRGWRCSQCGEMQFIKTEFKQTQQNGQPQQSNNPIIELLKRQNEILVKILNAVSKETSVEPEEMKPDQEIPF